MDTSHPESTPPPVSAAVPATVVSEDKTVAIVSYLTLIGFIVAVVLHGQKKTRLGSFHLRQSLGLMIGFIATSILSAVPFIGWILFPFLMLACVVFWIMGFIAAASGQMKPLPLVGEHFQKWFGTAFD